MAPVQDFGGPNSQMMKQKYKSQEQQLLTQPDWTQTELKPFRKNFYILHQNAKNRTPEDIEQYRDANDIIVRGNAVPQPNFCFEEGSFPDYLMNNIIKQGENMEYFFNTC